MLAAYSGSPKAFLSEKLASAPGGGAFFSAGARAAIFAAARGGFGAAAARSVDAWRSSARDVSRSDSVSWRTLWRSTINRTATPTMAIVVRVFVVLMRVKVL